MARGDGLVLVFDDRPEPVTQPDPNGTDRTAFPLVIYTGPRGAKGDPGDENVLVLELGQEVPEDTPDGRIIYRLLEEI